MLSALGVEPSLGVKRETIQLPCSFWLDPKRTKKVKIVVRFHPHAPAGSHDNQADARFN
jgi:hypothetical protein